jgi:hypothetical protein
MPPTVMIVVVVEPVWLVVNGDAYTSSKLKLRLKIWSLAEFEFYY